MQFSLNEVTQKNSAWSCLSKLAAWKWSYIKLVISIFNVALRLNGGSPEGT